MTIETYKGNPNLKSAQVHHNYTEKEVAEFIKCSKDPVYFIQKYVKIVSIDEGLIPFNLYPFQKDIIGTFHKNRFTICKLPRQSGKSTTILSYLIYYIIFNGWIIIYLNKLMLFSFSTPDYIIYNPMTTGSYIKSVVSKSIIRKSNISIIQTCCTTPLCAIIIK